VILTIADRLRRHPRQLPSPLHHVASAPRRRHGKNSALLPYAPASASATVRRSTSARAPDGQRPKKKQRHAHDTLSPTLPFLISDYVLFLSQLI